MEPTSRSPELRPEIVFLFDLVRQLVDGNIRIPRFQRPFVWRKEQMIDLLDSIYKQYPIGSLLAWETDEEIVSIESIGPVVLNGAPTQTPTYLLDGHQRLSTIAGALVSSKDRAAETATDGTKWNIAFNAADQSFEHYSSGVSLSGTLFPMSKILDTFDFLGECQRILNENPKFGKLYVERIQDLARRFQNYKIPMILIKQTGLTEAVEIFARLNSRGQDMTADQMVSAVLYREDDANGFDLAGEIDEMIEALTEIDFGGIDRSIVLKAIMAAIGEDIYRTDWTRMAHARREALLQRIQGVIPSVRTALLAAVKFLSTELGVTTDRLIPYSMQLVVIFSLFYSEENPSQEQVRLIKRWFWVTSFSTWFGGANPSKVNDLVRDVMQNVAKERESPSFSKFDLTEPAVRLPQTFDMRSARARTLMLVLLSLGPRDRYGNEIKNPGKLISAYGPEAVGHLISSGADKEFGRSPANRMFRDDPLDRGPTSRWLLECEEERLEEIWASHALPLTAKVMMISGDFNGVLRARAEELSRLEYEFLTSRGVSEAKSGWDSESGAESGNIV